nr:MAG TPA: Single strand binding protein [Caudoviricetes sp.]
MAFNKVILIGNLTKDIELKQMQSGMVLTSFDIAVARAFKNKQTGETETDFIRCQAWGKTAEFLSRYFSKGKAVVVEGDLRNNNYTDQNGVKHYGFVVNVQAVSFAGNKSDSQSAPQLTYNNKPPQNNPQQFVSNAQGAGVPSGLDDLAGFEEIISDGDVPF